MRFSLGERQLYIDSVTEGQYVATTIHSCKAGDDKPLINSLAFVWNADGRDQNAVFRSGDKLSLLVHIKSLELFHEITAIPAHVVVKADVYIWEPKLLSFKVKMPDFPKPSTIRRLLGLQKEH